MCNRITLRTSLVELLKALRMMKLPDVPARHNIAPTQNVLIVRCTPSVSPPFEGGEKCVAEAALVHWGLVPSWAAGGESTAAMFNARAETIDRKPAFRRAFRERRCLIPVDGFYEWQPVGRKKQPYLITFAGDAPFALAGLWERCDTPNGPLESCTIITTDSNALVRPMHDRMPAILDPSQFELWLDPAVKDPARLKPLLQPYSAEKMRARAVSRYVNNSNNEGPQCIAPAETDADAQGTLF